MSIVSVSVCARKARFVPAFALCLSAVLTSAHAQSAKDPLSDEQVEQVRDTGDQPAQRIKLYTKFIEERTAEIHKATSDRHVQLANARIHNLFEEFTRLADELQDNMETYSESHIDLRKPLKELLDHNSKWETALSEPKPSPDYDFARKTALDTAASTKDLARKMLDEEEAYFAKQKDKK